MEDWKWNVSVNLLPWTTLLSYSQLPIKISCIIRPAKWYHKPGMRSIYILMRYKSISQVMSWILIMMKSVLSFYWSLYRPHGYWKAIYKQHMDKFDRVNIGTIQKLKIDIWWHVQTTYTVYIGPLSSEQAIIINNVFLYF